jgi:outer membrane protein OmpA-like peptidoglycan-associated protein
MMGILLGIACTAPLAAQQQDAGQRTELLPQKARITDEALYADHSRYQATQDRIQALNDGGRPVRDYHLSKAQCWLDVSFHEYSRNDRSDFPQLALDESVKLIDGMERGVSPMPTDTPLVNDARYLREDLWKRLRVIHGTPGFECAQQAVACGEVELVHAGNEFNQQQWRHSKPYIQIAEDLTNDAEALARQCVVEPAITPAQEAVLTANVVFDFDKDRQGNIRAESLRGLDDVLRRVGEEKRTITGVQLVGHADRLKGPTDQYNQGLSERRAQTVRQLLISRGIAADSINYEWRGDSEQVQACDGMSGAKLRECLLPNRRVEVRFNTTR